MHPVPPSATSQPPVVPNVEVDVRTGGVVTIPVLDDAYDPDGDRLTLRTELAEPLASGQGLLFVSGDVLRYQAPDEPAHGARDVRGGGRHRQRDRRDRDRPGARVGREREGSAAAAGPGRAGVPGRHGPHLRPARRDRPRRRRRDAARHRVVRAARPRDGDGRGLARVPGVPRRGRHRRVHLRRRGLGRAARGGHDPRRHQPAAHRLGDRRGTRRRGHGEAGPARRGPGAGERRRLERRRAHAGDRPADGRRHRRARSTSRRIVVQAPDEPGVLQIAYTASNERGGRDTGGAHRDGVRGRPGAAADRPRRRRARDRHAGPHRGLRRRARGRAEPERAAERPRGLGAGVAVGRRAGQRERCRSS